ncbi:MAG: hypothetical protein V7L22_31215 [Nostoc sp.]|uniref:hypothetical protein n=1 Tax=Nostoc sp. TaxID=1180 RepID=UPI002FF4882D
MTDTDSSNIRKKTALLRLLTAFKRRLNEQINLCQSIVFEYGTVDAIMDNNFLKSMLYMIMYFTVLPKRVKLVEVKEIKYECRQSMKLCKQFLTLMEFPNQFDSLPNDIQNRLTELADHLSRRERCYLKPYI